MNSECISGLNFFREESLRRALKKYTIHYHHERNRQRKENQLLFPIKTLIQAIGRVILNVGQGKVVCSIFIIDPLPDVDVQA